MNTAKVDRNQMTPYQQPFGEVLAALGTDARHGLSQEEARARLERYGRNGLTAEKPARPLFAGACRRRNQTPDCGTSCGDCRD